MFFPQGLHTKYMVEIEEEGIRFDNYVEEEWIRFDNYVEEEEV